MSLNHQLKNRLREAEIDKPKAERQPTDPNTAKVAKAANSDPLINDSVTSVGEKVIKSALDAPNTAEVRDVTLPVDDLFTDEDVEISQAEKDDFLAALVSGGRYEQKFSVYNGRIRGRLRCRSTDESEAIAAWVNTGIRDNRFATPLDYSIAVRNALLAAQVMELNGTRYTELTEPLYRTSSGDDTTDPGWVAAADAWSKQPEPVVSAVYNELKLFERKYWTMIAHATKQDFWRPVESTSR